jgi:dihydrofolate synthase/folylpolyglutamate synthase
LIGEAELCDLLLECEIKSPEGGVTMFEAMTAVAFAAFARHPADFTILETGLGGRLDATNVVEHPRATLIARLSYDHREFLGNTLTEIAREKAGIMKKGSPCFTAPQPDEESIATLRACAASTGSPLFIGNEKWGAEPHMDGKGFRFTDAKKFIDLPLPALPGAHQFWNAGLAIAALRGTGFTDDAAIIKGMSTVEWPARLQKLGAGTLAKIVGAQGELWLDGGHNDSAGEVLAQQAHAWSKEENPRALHLILGMLTTKKPVEFLAPLLPYIASLHTVDIPDETQAFKADDLVEACRAAGFKNAQASGDIAAALRDIKSAAPGGRILIAGSLYLAGNVLRLNNSSMPMGS